MQNSFQHYIKRHRLFLPEDMVLLSVSGGIDSMVMLHLFEKSKFRFAVAHCNFQLRGKESDEDEKFLKSYCQLKNIAFYAKKFETEKLAKEKGISIQMAARQLRMRWFEDLLKNENFDYYATAHHKNDQAESFFINLMRGTGIAGVHGILPKQNKLIHPMMFCNRREIESFACENEIPFREDSSNQKTDYLRNKIRHRIMPALENMEALFVEKVDEHTQIMQFVENLYREKLQEMKRQIWSEQSGLYLINIEKLMRSKFPAFLLFEMIRVFSFDFDIAKNIIKSINNTGKQFFAGKHVLTVNRDELIISDESKAFQLEASVFPNVKRIAHPVNLEFNYKDFDAKEAISKDRNTATLDAEKLQFPLDIRRWKQGDKFMPFGMKHFKKVSDYFIDEKFSIPQKQNTWLLLSDNQIVWIIGHRIDQRFCVDEHTKKVVEIKKII